jgi:hypothetical protein
MGSEHKRSLCYPLAMTTIVYNACFGGFSLSGAAMRRLHELKGTRWDGYDNDPLDLSRSDPALVQVIRELGTLANGRHAKLQTVTLVPGTRYFISDYDGSETVETKDTIVWKVA